MRSRGAVGWLVQGLARAPFPWGLRVALKMEEQYEGFKTKSGSSKCPRCCSLGRKGTVLRRKPSGNFQCLQYLIVRGLDGKRCSPPNAVGFRSLAQPC